MEYVTVGGAKSSEIKPPFHKIPLIALQRLAMRFRKGEHYDDPAEAGKLNGAMNWQQGDEAFWVERYNHAFEHLLKYGAGDRSEDHLAAVMWFCAARMSVDQATPAFHLPYKECREPAGTVGTSMNQVSIAGGTGTNPFPPAGTIQYPR